MTEVLAAGGPPGRSGGPAAWTVASASGTGPAHAPGLEGLLSLCWATWSALR